MSNEHLDHDAQDFTTPEWLRDALKESHVSPAFLARCYDAASIAYDISRLRREAERREFDGAPFKQFVLELAKPLGISVERIAQWLGIDDLGRLDGPAIGPLFRLARDLGLQAAEFSTRLRVGFAIEAGRAPLPMLPFRRHGLRVPSTRLDEYRKVLDDVESRYSADLRGRLRTMMDEVDKQLTATAE